MTTIRLHTGPGGLDIAYRRTTGSGPAIVFLPGYMSDMEGGKATAIFDWCVAQGRECLLFDYSGCGKSTGDFADGTMSRWRDEALALIAAHVASREIIVIGSSMGGWLMLMVGLALGNRLAGLVGIAPAPDFTRWGYTEAHRVQLAAGQTVFEDNPYGPEPTPTYPGFFADAEAQLMLHEEVGIDAPVRLVHGQRDADVPWEISLRLAAALRSDDVQVTLVKGGDHRLSRDQDIALLLSVLDRLADRKPS